MPSRVVLLTGAAGGIGRVMTQALLADGHTPSPTELGREFGADAEWVRNQIRAVKKNAPAQPATVPAARPATDEEA